MDATMQRMKWIADWEYVLGVNLLNPHGFHYTLEGPRKRDWPPSMFYQYPWWQYYGDFSGYTDMAVGLALFISIYRRRDTIAADEIDLMKW